jgi:hypothetical protein
MCRLFSMESMDSVRPLFGSRIWTNHCVSENTHALPSNQQNEPEVLYITFTTHKSKANPCRVHSFIPQWINVHMIGTRTLMPKALLLIVQLFRSRHASGICIQALEWAYVHTNVTIRAQQALLLIAQSFLSQHKHTFIDLNMYMFPYIYM